MKKALAVGFSAGAACAGAALAQRFDVTAGIPFGGAVRVDPVGFPARPGYSPRVVATVYDNLANVVSNGTGGTYLPIDNCIEDCGFTGGPWAGATGRRLTEITFGVAALTTPTTTEQILLIYWDRDNLNFAGQGNANGASMLAPGSVPLGVARVDVGSLPGGFVYQITASLTGFPGGGLLVPDGDTGVAVQVVWITNGFTPTNNDYTNLVPNASGGTYSQCASTGSRGIAFGSSTLAPYNGGGVGPGTANAASVGTTLPDYGRDIPNAAMCPNIGRFIGNGGIAVNTGNVEHRYITGVPAGDIPIAITYGQQLRLRGSVYCPPPAAVTALGPVPDSGLNRTAEVVDAGQAKWYSFSLASGATDAALHFLDIDTEGSPGDVAIALYDAEGNPAGGLNRGFDTASSGMGTADQLTFGVGRRASAGGDGRQYDGRSGQLSAGTYYLSVVARGGTFGTCFAATPPVTGGGSFQLHLRTNVNGGALVPAVAPQVPMADVGQDYGTLNPNAGDTGVGSPMAIPSDGVYWDKFTLSAPVTSTNYLDIDFARASTPTVDGIAYIFNSAGNIVYYSDDEGPGALPQFSIGAGDLPPGAHAGLPAGTYYMAIGLFETQDLRGISPHSGRFHVRGPASSGLLLSADLFTGTICGTADFDGDGDIGTDRDIEAFFRCLAGTCCPTCWRLGADFNGDGDVGTDADIEAFFRVLAGSPC